MANVPYTTDTTSAAFEVQLDCSRRMSPQDRIRRTYAVSRRIKQMAFDAIRRRFPDLSEQQVQFKFIELTYGANLAADVSDWVKERGVERNR